MLLSFFLPFFFVQNIVAQESSQNWTSCEEFVNNTVFDPESVLNVDWRIFYFWNPNTEVTYNIRFSRPTKTLVDRFRVELDKELLPRVNWTNAELFMESTIDFSALYVRTNISGIYRLVPSSAFEYTGIPVLIFALKVVEPGYLGISNCKHRFCYGLAPFDKMPETDKLEDAAKLLGFYSEFNSSIVTDAPPIMNTPLPLTDMDENYNPDPDMEMDPNKLDLF